MQRPGQVFDEQQTLLVALPLRTCLQRAHSAVFSFPCAEAGSDSDALQQTSLVAQQLRQQQLKRQGLAVERRARDSSVDRSLSPSRAGSMQLVRLELVTGQMGRKKRSSLSLPTLLWMLLCWQISRSPCPP